MQGHVKLHFWWILHGIYLAAMVWDVPERILHMILFVLGVEGIQEDT